MLEKLLYFVWIYRLGKGVNGKLVWEVGECGDLGSGVKFVGMEIGF